jgi:hypothetical protein
VVGCSLAAFFVGLLGTRVRGNAAGLVVAVCGGGLATFAILSPLAASQVAAAVQPGVAALLVVLASQAALRWYHRTRVTYLPGFTRRPIEPEPSATGASKHPPRTTGSLVPLGEQPVSPSGT